MDTTPDLVVEIFYIQQKEFWRLNGEALASRVRENYPNAAAAEIEDAAKKARALYELAQISYYDAPSPSAAADCAIDHIKKKLPGLSDRAYSAAAMIAMRNWVM